MTFSIVHIVQLDATGDSRYRMEWPIESLAKLDPSLHLLTVHAQAKERYELAAKADLLVLFQTNDVDFISVIEQRKQAGLQTICEFNDNFYAPQPWSPVAKAWSSNHLRATYELFLTHADQIMVTSEGLRDLFASRTNVPMTIIQNAIPDLHASLDSLVAQKKRHSFGWAGSLGHVADILSVGPMVKAYLASHPAATFHVMGNESLASNLHLQEQYFYTGWGPVERYFEFWDSIEVGIIPLLDTPYNQCRSDIKVLEMVSRGVVPIVPFAKPYQTLIEKFKIPCYRQLRELMTRVDEVFALSQEQRFALLAPLYAYIQEQRLQLRDKERLEFYRSCLPSAPRAQMSNAPLGYSFFQGTEDAAPLHAARLAESQALLKEHKTQEALQLLQEAVNSSPLHLEYAWHYAQILARQQPSYADIFVSDALLRFPHDMRFRALSLLLSDSVELAQMRMRSVLNFLAQQDKLTQRGAYAYLQRPFVQLLEKMPELIDTLEEVFLIYPFAYQLRFKLAEVYERQGRTKEARAHFDALRKAREQFEDGASEIGQFDLGYLSAWSAALDARYNAQR
jgi:tetratricopeptide (TPR) repeat protein